jgi:hypothetical protein
VTVNAELLYLDSGTWKSLPQWGRFLVSVGKAAGTRGRADERLVLAIIVPTRAYAAALLALGLVAARGADGAEADGLAEHVAHLRALPLGSSVYLASDGRRQKAWFQGWARLADGEERIRIQLERAPGPRQSGGDIRWLPVSDAPKIKVAGEPFGELPRRPTSAQITAHGDFVAAVLGGNDPDAFALRGTRDCLLLGTVGRLRVEVTGTPLSVVVGGRPGPEGVLNDILRVRQFQRSDEPHRSEVHRGNDEAPATDTAPDHPPYAVVFDGATPFLRLRDRFRQAHWAVIIDRYDPGLAEACEVFNAGYTQDRSIAAGRQHDGLPRSMPPGVEAAGYREAQA